MKVLISCEESQAVCKEFRRLGHEAYSCDIQECSGGYPEWHICGDVIEQFNKGWDMMIAFPPCKYLAWSGERWLKDNPERQANRKEAFEFLKAIYWQNIPMIALENNEQEDPYHKLCHKIHFNHHYI